MKKLTGTAKALDTIAHVLQVLCMVAAIMLAVAVVLLLVFNIEAYEFDSRIELGNFSFVLASVDPSAVHTQFLWTAPPAIGGVLVMWLVLRLIRRLLAPMREGKPFDSSVSRNLRSLSWITLIGGAVCSLLKSIAEIAVYRIYDFHSLFQNDLITGCTLNIAPDMSFVLLFAILFLLSCVFRYGEELQKQSDETL